MKDPKTCDNSLGCISGTATQAADGNTLIEAQVDIHIPSLPAVSIFNQALINPFIQRWQTKLLAEFVANWQQMHPEN